MPQSKTPFFDFLGTLDPERKDNFLKALSEHEIMEFSQSEEEYRMISDSDEDVPENFFAFRPLKAKEVGSIEDPTEEFKNRLEEIETEFPPKSLRRLKQIAQEKMNDSPKPETRISITIEQLREKASGFQDS